MEFTPVQSEMWCIYIVMLFLDRFFVKYYGKGLVKLFVHEADTFMCCQDNRKLRESETGFGLWGLISWLGLYESED